MFRLWCGGAKAQWANDLTISDFIRAYDLQTPFFRLESQRNLARVPKNVEKAKHIRRYAMINPVFGQVLLDERFGVAPKAWPKVMAEVFPVDDAPTPYEVACAVLRFPCSHFWSFVETYPDEQVASAFIWYLAGAPPKAIAQALDITTQTLYRRLAHLLHRAMGTAKLVIWVVSTDLMPIVTNQSRARALAALYRGESISRWLPDSRNSFRIYDDIVNTPYFQAQLKARRAIKRIPRPIYTPGVVFPTIEAKREWESTDSMDTRWLSRHRSQLQKLNPKDICTWSRLPLRVPVYDRDDPEVKRELRRRARKRRQRAATRSSQP